MIHNPEGFCLYSLPLHLCPSLIQVLISPCLIGNIMSSFHSLLFMGTDALSRKMAHCRRTGDWGGSCGSQCSRVLSGCTLRSLKKHGNFVFYWFNHSRPYSSRNLSISSRFSNSLAYNFSKYSLMSLWILVVSVIIYPFLSLILFIWDSLCLSLSFG